MKEFIKELENHIVSVFKEYESDQVKIQVTDDRRNLIDYLYCKENLLNIERNIESDIGQNEVTFIWNPASNLHELYIER
ncbi:MAG: hypothetical protein ACRCX2_37795 [Paraclostridium sp.]